MDSCAVERQSLLITSTFTRLLDQISRAIASRLPTIRPEPRLSIPTTPLWTLKLMNHGDKVIHHVEASWRQDQVGSDLVRFAKVQGDRLTLRTPPMIVGGVRVVSELVWERMK